MSCVQDVGAHIDEMAVSDTSMNLNECLMVGLAAMSPSVCPMVAVALELVYHHQCETRVKS